MHANLVPLHARQYGGEVGKTVQIRNLDPVVEERLRKRASSEGLSLSAYLRRELALLAERQEFWDRWNDFTPDGPGLSGDAAAEIIREMRGPLP